jgi:hypothetical protein
MADKRSYVNSEPADSSYVAAAFLALVLPQKKGNSRSREVERKNILGCKLLK